VNDVLKKRFQKYPQRFYPQTERCLGAARVSLLSFDTIGKNVLFRQGGMTGKFHGER